MPIFKKIGKFKFLEVSQMKRLIFSVLILLAVVGLNGCSSDPKDTLKSSIKEYKGCMIDNDFQCVAKLTDPSLIETMGGVDGYTKLMKSSGLTISAINIKNISQIKKDGKTMSSQIKYSQTADMNGEKMTMDGSLIATSKDNGSSWFFETQQ